MLIKQILNETTKFTKLRRYLLNAKNTGDTNSGVTIATPMNPKASNRDANYADMSPEDQQELNRSNNILWKRGEQHIKRMHKNYFKQKGVFEGEEEFSFVIFDTTEAESIELGEKWDQSSIIHMSVRPTKVKGQYMLSISMVATVKGSPISDNVLSAVSDIFNAPEGAIDYYSEVGGHKWVIPFFDDEAEAEFYLRKEYGDDADQMKHKLARRKSGKNKGQVIMVMDKTGTMYKFN